MGFTISLDTNNATITALRLEADDSEDRFALIGLTEGALAPGTFEVSGLGGDRGPGRFLAVYQYPSENAERPGQTFAIGDEGSVTIARADDDVIEGSFAFTAQTPRFSRQPDGTVLANRDTIDVEGTFVAEVREVDRSPVTR